MEETKISKQENLNNQEDLEDSNDSFLSKVTDFFIKLMDKFTEGKYSTKEEQDFFSDEKKMYYYDENGKCHLTQEYKDKINEFGEYVKQKDVDKFLQDIHSVDSDEFGPAYSETEKTILASGLDYVSNQQRIYEEILKAKKAAKKKGIPFDIDAFLKKKVEQEGETYDEAKDNIRLYVTENIDGIAEECPELVEFLGACIEEANSNIDEKRRNDNGTY